MLTREGCKARRQRLWEKLTPKPDWIVIADPQHLVYFANYYQSPFVFRSNDAGAMLILGQDGSSILVADNLLQPFCDKAHVDEVLTPTWYRSVESAPHREAFLIKNTIDRLAKGSGRHFGLEAAAVPVGLIEGLRQNRGSIQITNIDPVIAGLKRKKDEDELKVMRLSMKAGEAGMAAGLAGIHPGMTELEAYQLVQRAVLDAVGDQAIVYGDFVSGPRCEEIGGPPTTRKISAGELVILDFSTVLFQYRADFANTHVCGGRPTEELRALAQACAEAMNEGEKQLRPGTSGQSVDRAVRGYFEARHLEKNFPHHTGHGIGLGHPEPPFFTPQSSDTLVAGDVVTIEPGQYIKGVGGMRFERNYLITETGFELLSHHTIGLVRPG